MTGLTWLDDQPRFLLGHWPTPLEPLPNLSRELGGPTIWLKRDDCSGLATGGNKTRKLEFLVGDALTQDADTLLTFGAVQSNHARQTAAAAAKAGLKCHLLLSRQVTHDDLRYESGGNVLLDRMFGAVVHMMDPDEDVAQFSQQLVDDLQSNGHRVCVIPAGGSNPIGVLGYAACAAELGTQIESLSLDVGHIVHASSSAGTQAGLLFGLGCLGLEIDVLGINVYHPDPEHLKRRVARLLDNSIETFGVRDACSPRPIRINHAYFGEGYGQPAAETVQAIRSAAQLEGVLFDPVYSGKALAGLLDQINLGNFADRRDVVLIHTGGTTALHVYEHLFR